MTAEIFYLFDSDTLMHVSWSSNTGRPGESSPLDSQPIDAYIPILKYTIILSLFQRMKHGTSSVSQSVVTPLSTREWSRFKELSMESVILATTSYVVGGVTCVLSDTWIRIPIDFQLNGMLLLLQGVQCHWHRTQEFNVYDRKFNRLFPHYRTRMTLHSRMLHFLLNSYSIV